MPSLNTSAPSPITLRQVAEACGVSRMTVSRALRGMPLVESGLAAEIRAKAAELGYRQNQALGRLMRATRLSARGDYLETIAVIRTGPKNLMEEECQGLRQQAELFHMKLDEFVPTAEGMTGNRMASVLNARGIRGIILVPGGDRAHPHYWLPPGRFCCVLLGKSLRNHGIPRVQHDHYQSGIMAMNRLRRLGYRRPGLVIGSVLHDRSWRSYGAAMAAYAPDGLSLAEAVCSKPKDKDIDLKTLRTWLRRYRPDSVLVEHPGTAQVLRHLNENLGLVVMNTYPSAGHWSGIVPQRVQIGQEAVRLLAMQLLGSEPCEPDNPPVVNVPGLWHEGESLPPRRPTVGRVG